MIASGPKFYTISHQRWTLVGIPADVGSGVGSNWHTLLQAGLEEVMLSYIHHQVSEAYTLIACDCQLTTA